MRMGIAITGEEEIADREETDTTQGYRERHQRMVTSHYTLDRTATTTTRGSSGLYVRR